MCFIFIVYDGEGVVPHLFCGIWLKYEGLNVTFCLCKFHIFSSRIFSSQDYAY